MSTEKRVRQMISNPRSVTYDDIVSVGRTLGLQEHIGKHHKFV